MGFQYGSFKSKYEDVDLTIQKEMINFSVEEKYEYYSVDALTVKRLMIKTFPFLEQEWNQSVGLMLFRVNIFTMELFGI